MLFRSKDLEAIVAGTRKLAFRRWKRPTVKVGGTIRTQMGLVGIDTIEPIDPATLTEAEAREGGYANLDKLVAMFEGPSRAPATASASIMQVQTHAKALPTKPSSRWRSAARSTPGCESWMRSRRSALGPH